jgi:hypothetical protein
MSCSRSTGRWEGTGRCDDHDGSTAVAPRRPRSTRRWGFTFGRTSMPRPSCGGVHRPELVPRWWGHGTTTKVVEMDIRPRRPLASSAGAVAMTSCSSASTSGRPARTDPLDVHVRDGGRRGDGRPGDPLVRGDRWPDEGDLGRSHGPADVIDGALATGGRRRDRDGIASRRCSPSCKPDPPARARRPCRDLRVPARGGTARAVG